MRAFWLGFGMAMALPLMILNWAAGVIGFIWLAILGDWRAIGIGILIIAGGMFALSFVMMIGVAIAMPGFKIYAKSRWLAMPFLIAAGLFNFVVATVWCVEIFSVFINRPHGNVWPYILWAYSAATSTWATMAQKETQTDPSAQSLMWAAGVQFGALAALVSVLVGDGYQSDFGMTIFFIPSALIGMFLTSQVLKERHRAY